jgi:hypothetical protein
MVKAYCVVCKEKNVEMKDPVIGRTSKGGYIAKGICSKCNKTKMCAMMSKDNAEAAIKAGDAKDDTKNIPKPKKK